MSSMKPRREQVLDIARDEIGGEVPSLRDMDSGTAQVIADAEKQVYGRQAPIELAGMGAQAQAAAAANEGSSTGALSMADEVRQVTGGEFIPAMRHMDMGTARGLQAAEAKAHGGVNMPGGLGSMALSAAEGNEQRQG